MGVSVDEKILSIDELAAALEAHRGDGRRVVHCHGVFDLLHIGHIRYLAGARKLGDLLVVTLTPDRFVNKGPHRPAFGEELRAEALASLDCVDYVAINEWPTAVETIRALKPHVYAKGAEFRENRTPEMVAEEEAVREGGTEIAFIEDITSSSSRLINQHLSPFDDDVAAHLQGLADDHGPDGLLAYLSGAKGSRVLVVGEAMVDEYYYCQCLQRSSKAPVLAMQYTSHERFAGGTVAIANHLAAFCDDVTLLSTVGSDDENAAWLQTQLRPNVRPVFVPRPGAPTIVKRRYIESYFSTPALELYIMDQAAPSEEDESELCGRISAEASAHDLVIAADYGHGMLTERGVSCLCEAAPYLTVNTQANAGNVGYHTASKYPRADFISLAEHELRLECRQREGELRPMLNRVARRLGASCAAVTRGKHGCITWSRDGTMRESPAVAARVVDRVGAGDAFLAIASLAARHGAPPEVWAFLGNVAAAEIVATLGNRQPIEAQPFSRHVISLLK